MTEAPTNLPAVRQTRGAQSLVAGAHVQALIPVSWAGVANLANVVHESGLAPRELNTPQKCAIAILHGLEIGLPPMAALQKIAVINGRPTIWGDAALALVMSRDVSEFVQEKFEGEGEKLKAVCRSLRKGKQDVVERSFSVKQAIRANLWDDTPMVRKRFYNKQSRQYETAKLETPNDSSWYRFPERMLQMRARGLCLRDTYPDILMGLYLREELDDGNQQAPEPVEELPPDPNQPLSTEEPHEEATEQAVEDTERSVQEGPATEAEGEEGDALQALEDAAATASEWIAALANLPSEEEVKDYITDNAIYEHCELGHFDERMAAKIENAINQAMGRVADDGPPDPGAYQ